MFSTFIHRLDSFIFDAIGFLVSMWSERLGKSNFTLARLVIALVVFLLIIRLVNGNLRDAKEYSPLLLYVMCAGYLVLTALKVIRRVEKEFKKSFHSDTLSLQLAKDMKRDGQVRIALLILVFISLLWNTLFASNIGGSLITISLFFYAIHFYVLYNFHLGGGAKVKVAVRSQG